LRKTGIEIGFGREGRARTRTISIATTPNYLAAEDEGQQPSASSAPSALTAKPSPANGFLVGPLRTLASDADGLTVRADDRSAPTVRATPLKTNGADGADGADANCPPHSAPENTGTAGWKVRI
jgi:hypothetical protein